MKELPSSNSDDIEMRLCVDQTRWDEDISFETVDLMCFSLLVLCKYAAFDVPYAAFDVVVN